MPVPGSYRRRELSKEEFYKRLKAKKDALLSRLKYPSVAILLSKKAGYRIGVEEDPAVEKLEAGDKMLVFGAHDINGIKTGHGVVLSEVEFLGD